MKKLALVALMAFSTPALAGKLPLCKEVDAFYIALLEEEVGEKCVSDKEVTREGIGTAESFAEAYCKFRGFSMSYRFQCQ